MQKILLSVVFLTAYSVNLLSFTLNCTSQYTITTSDKGDGKFETKYGKDNGKNKINIEADDKIYVVSGSDKKELLYLGKGGGSTYMVEKTGVGTFNMYSLFNNGTLTVSKSFDLLCMSKIYVQSVWQCSE